MEYISEPQLPAREYITTPSVPEEVIESELRTGGSGEMLKENVLKGLGAIYGKSRFAKTIHDYADVLDLTRQEQAARSARSYTALGVKGADAFYAGSLLAVHAELSLDTPYVRKTILGSLVSEPEGLDLSADAQRRLRIDTLSSISQDHYGWFDALPDSLQKMLVVAAEQMFDEGSQTAAACQVEMIFGYVLATAAIHTYRLRCAMLLQAHSKTA